MLALSAIVMGVDRRRVDEVLDVVGLTERESHRRVRNYSLGMRQRLGLAHALLGDPEVLVLDEPANGLDPAGIRWMRSLLRGYADEGGTVLLSSHLLNEIELVADEIVVIGGGRIVAAGTKQELLQGQGTLVRSTDTAALEGALRAEGWLHQPSHRGRPPRRGRAGRRRRRGGPTRRAARRAAARRRPRARGHVPRAHRQHRT